VIVGNLRAMGACGVALGLLQLAAAAAAAQPAGGTPSAAPPAAMSGPVPELGPRIGYGFDLRAWSLGAQGRLPLLPGFTLLPSADYFLATGSAAWQVSLDVEIRPGWWRGVYGGAGLGVANRGPGSTATRTGLDVFLGLAPPMLRQGLLRPYLEARWLLIANSSPFHLVAGCNVRLRS
jgi:hypothetical protein